MNTFIAAINSRPESSGVFLDPPIILLFVSLILGTLALIFGLAYLISETYFFENIWKLIRSPFITHVKPVIAYKKAVLDPNGELKGVTGTPYKANDEAVNGMGFHAYSSFQRARKHTQEGDVMLEVLLSGEIKKMDLGYIAEKQRVLQVIPYKCAYWGCQGVPQAFSLKGPDDWRSDDEKPAFLCHAHSKADRFESKLRKLVAPLTRLFGEEADQLEVLPLSALGEKLPWIEENKIVVSTLSGKNKFVPTVIPD